MMQPGRSLHCQDECANTQTAKTDRMAVPILMAAMVVPAVTAALLCPAKKVHLLALVVPAVTEAEAAETAVRRAE